MHSPPTPRNAELEIQKNALVARLHLMATIENDSRTRDFYTTALGANRAIRRHNGKIGPRTLTQSPHRQSSALQKEIVRGRSSRGPTLCAPQTWPGSAGLRKQRGVVRSLRPALTLATVLVFSPCLARSQQSDALEPPRPSLDKIQLVDDHYEAPTRSGIAELTLRHDLQALSGRLLARARPVRGAAIMVDTRSGKVLVFDRYVRHGTAPLSLLTQASAPAASLFKLVTTAALLAKTPVSPSTRVCTRGGEAGIGRRHLQPPPRELAEQLCAPFWQALGHSRNAVYAQLSTQHLLRGDLLQMAQAIGFDSELAFDVPAQVGHVELPYNDLEFARASAGFVGSTLSPLGVAHLTLAIARGGKAARMTLIDRQGDYRAPARAEELGTLMRTYVAHQLRRMMEVTVHSGTSLDAFTSHAGVSYLGQIRVAGKTGTLQPSPNVPTTSWFTGFAPSRNPHVVVTVLLQNSSVWRRKANEVARDLLRAYFIQSPGVTHPEQEE